MQLKSEHTDSDATSVDSRSSRFSPPTDGNDTPVLTPITPIRTNHQHYSIDSGIPDLKPKIRHESGANRALAQLARQAQILYTQTQHAQTHTQQNYVRAPSHPQPPAMGHYLKTHGIGSPEDNKPPNRQQDLASVPASPLTLSVDQCKGVPRAGSQHDHLRPNIPTASIARVPPSKILRSQLDVSDSPAPDLNAPRMASQKPKTQVDGKSRPSMLTDNGSPKNRKKDFKDLPAIRQKGREARLRAIKEHWGCPVRDCIPQNIRPRKQDGAWRKAHQGDEAAIENDPRNWSDHLLNELSALSRITRKELGYAQKLMLEQVNRRLADVGGRKGRHATVVEILLSDLKRATAIAHERNSVANQTSDSTIIPSVEKPEDGQKPAKYSRATTMSRDATADKEEVVPRRASTTIGLQYDSTKGGDQMLSDDGGYQASADSRSPSPLANRSAPLQGVLRRGPMPNPQEELPETADDSADVKNAADNITLTGDPHVRHYSEEAYNAYMQMLHYQNMVAEGRARAFRQQEQVFELQALASTARAQAAEARTRALLEEANADQTKFEIHKLAFNRTMMNERREN
ncbi:hypothetical protein AOQ84DRAFT_426814 [Glonium stellatum]|uniref:Uncharacterized protein n=1 Tax=Glonium stellatum TaxID=574774 RepID=A0A8E2EMU6_9PEZI|nr:hypothetical protein AOQ84DRAFT_426814 [Glonium stellatum]